MKEQIIKAMFIGALICDAIENELDCINKNDIEQTVEGSNDYVIAYWESMEQDVLNNIQNKVNLMLEVYYGKN